VKGQYVDDPELIIKHRKRDYSSTYLLRYLFEPDISDHTALTGAVDLKRDYKIGSWIKGFIKTGAKVKYDDRMYDQNHQMVFWYYLLPSYALNAAKKYPGLELGGPDNDKIMISNFYTSNDVITSGTTATISCILISTEPLLTIGMMFKKMTSQDNLMPIILITKQQKRFMQGT
jgi:hypothetical protein